ncbi:MAG: SHOCT domain-containing protein, partial [Propionibacterium sp.]|nr:SHOCT domain-containing protein [Propionibacterium sp.]
MGLFKTAAKVAVASSVHGRVQRRQAQRWAA